MAPDVSLHVRDELVVGLARTVVPHSQLTTFAMTLSFRLALGPCEPAPATINSLRSGSTSRARRGSIPRRRARFGRRTSRNDAGNDIANTA